MIYSIKRKQILKGGINEVWEFMSSPYNLEALTPASLAFDVLSDKDDLRTMYPGQIIEYYVSPVLGIKLHWVTEITQVKDKAYFIDEQRFGPYSFWHHKHFFKEVDGGIEMIDTVHYKLPFGFIGRLAHSLFIRKKLREIFDYRFEKMNDLFNAKSQSA